MITKLRKLLSRFVFSVKETAGMNAPVNFRDHDISQEKLEEDVKYAYGIGCSYLKALKDEGLSLQGLRVVEFGPGVNFGPALYLACHGIKPAVADRFLASWRKYHHLFYSCFRDFLKKEEPNLNLSPLDDVIQARKYPEHVLTLYPYSLEGMGWLPPAIWDVTFSNAVFEHLYNVRKAFHELARLTTPGGMGFHQVDHRDHRDFSKPWEFLLLSNKDFARIFDESHGECGNRVPFDQMSRLFEESGFEIVRTHQNMFAEDTYLAEFLPRLKASEQSSFRDYNQDLLKCISCQFVIRKRK